MSNLIYSNAREAARNGLKLIPMVVMILCFSLTSVAQAEPPMASLTQAGIVQLPAGEPLSETYLIDVSHMDFGSDQQMVAFFAERITDDYIVRAIPQSNQAFLALNVKKNANWTVAQWNARLAQVMAAKPIKK